MDYPLYLYCLISGISHYVSSRSTTNFSIKEVIFRQDAFNRMLDEQEEIDADLDREVEIEEVNQISIFL